MRPDVRQQLLIDRNLMQPQFMGTLSGLFLLVYVVCVIAVIVYVLKLLGRFVSAHERVASALEMVARKMREEDHP
jgi:hypothetical protein